MKPIFPLIALALIGTSVASAHTSLAAATPKSGAELDESPSTIEIQFADTAKLTSVVAIGGDKKERKLEFAAGDDATSYEVKQPNLSAGRNEVKWKALSKDGHVISGTLVYVVKAKSK